MSRVFFYVQHLLGIGHLRRAAVLARALVAGGFDVLLVSGGAPVEGLALGGARFHQLPPLRAADESLRDLARLDGSPVDEAFQRQRIDVLLGLLRAEAPDVVLTEQFPFGRTRLRFELLPLLEAARGLPKRPLIACSVRDVVRRAGPERIAETEQILRALFDAVLIHGDPRLVPFERSFAGWARIKERAFYTGYVSERDLAQGMHGSAEGKDEVVVSVGGGAVGAPLLKAAVAARPKTALADRHLAIAAGREPAGAGPGRARRRGRASSSSRRAPDFTTLLGNATLSISQAGYNTVIETLCCADRAVLVPFASERETEQADRAEALAERGMVAVVPPGTLSAQSLADAVGRALAGPSLKSFPPCDVDGGPKTAALLHRLLASMSTWADLSDEAARWREAGRTAELWWRDDDAADVGPALERLLAIHRDSGVPLALAVVPATATQALADRLGRRAGRRSASAWLCARQSCRVGDDKKIELGTERPAMLVLGELGTGRMALERLFGARPLPVLVPPWNRIAPALVPTLPEIGFAGLSTFGARRRTHPVRGLLEVNTHVDLIDWKGGRGFVGEAAALDALVAALARARASGEPVGVLSHHLAMDGGAWDFLRSMWQKALKMPGLRIRPAHELFATGGGRG